MGEFRDRLPDGRGAHRQSDFSCYPASRNLASRATQRRSRRTGTEGARMPSSGELVNACLRYEP